MGRSAFLILIAFSLALVSSSHVTNRRLRRDVIPSHYAITLVINKCDFSGKVAIDVEVLNTTDHFQLHSSGLAIHTDEIRLKKLPSEENVQITSVNGEGHDEEGFEDFLKDGSYRNLSVNSLKGDRIKLSLSEPLEVGSKYRLYMEFKGTMNSETTFGIYCRRYHYGNQTKWMVSTRFQPRGARSAFPCFDEPGLKSNFTITVVHDNKLTALSNMPINLSTPSDLGQNWVLDTFETSPKMSSYLVSIFVGDFQHIDSKYDGKNIKIWANSERVKYGDLTLRWATRHMAFLQNYTGWMVSTRFQPRGARSAFPCFDEPGLKSNFTITVVHDNKLTALSNMPISLSTSSDLGQNWVLDKFETSPKMSSYLVSIFVGDFQHIDSKYDGKNIKIWANSERVKYGDLPLRLATRHMAFLQNYTGIMDPMPKIDFLALRVFEVGGMENWGLISYLEYFILIDPKHRRSRQRVMYACNVIGHELSHIWFGNLVSVDSWRDIWLNEGFANYFADVHTDKLYKGYGTQAWIAARESAMNADCKSTIHPLRPKTDLDAIYIFDEITYDKGSSILRMINYTLGEKVLQKGIQEYLKERSFSTASHKKLWECLEKAARKAGQKFPEDVTFEEIMEPWLALPGYPVVTATRDYETGKITFTQQSVLESENEIREYTGPTGWFVPLSYTYQGENEVNVGPRIWLDPRQPNLTIADPAPSDKWILFNIRGSSYCRVRYDRKNADYLLNDYSDIWIEDRAQMVADMIELMTLDFNTVEGSLEYLFLFKHEESPFAWLALLGSASKTQNLFEGTELESLFADFINDILSIGMEKVENDAPHRKALVTLSCKIGVKQCTDMAHQFFKQWAQDPLNEVPEEIRFPVYCLGVTEGDEKTWELVNSRLTTAKDMSENRDILKALACTKDQKLLQKYLSYGLSSNKTSYPGKKLSVVLKSLAKQHPDFVLDTLSDTKNPPPRNNMEWQRLLEVLANQVNSPKRLEKFNHLVYGSDMYKSAERRKSSVINIAERNVKWMDNNKENAKNWFIKHIKSKRQNHLNNLTI